MRLVRSLLCCRTALPICGILMTANISTCCPAQASSVRSPSRPIATGCAPRSARRSKFGTSNKKRERSRARRAPLIKCSLKRHRRAQARVDRRRCRSMHIVGVVDRRQHALRRLQRQRDSSMERERLGPRLGGRPIRRRPRHRRARVRPSFIIARAARATRRERCKTRLFVFVVASKSAFIRASTTLVNQ